MTPSELHGEAPRPERKKYSAQKLICPPNLTKNGLMTDNGLRHTV
jgi:hypothetical protein